jgi:hypothetical protein
LKVFSLSCFSAAFSALSNDQPETLEKDPGIVLVVDRKMAFSLLVAKEDFAGTRPWNVLGLQ